MSAQFLGARSLNLKWLTVASEAGILGAKVTYEQG